MKAGGRPAPARRPSRPALQREISPLVAAIVIAAVVVIIVLVVWKPWKAMGRRLSPRQREMQAELLKRGWTPQMPLPEDLKQKYPEMTKTMPLPPPPPTPGR